MGLKFKLTPSQIQRGKAVVVVTWLLAIAAYLLPEQIPFSTIFIGMGAFLVIAHSVEILIFNNRLKSASNYIGVFFFGILHIKQLSFNHQNAQTK